MNADELGLFKRVAAELQELQFQVSSAVPIMVDLNERLAAVEFRSTVYAIAVGKAFAFITRNNPQDLTRLLEDLESHVAVSSRDVDPETALPAIESPLALIRDVAEAG